MAVTAFEAEKMQAGVSVVIGTFGVSSESAGPLPRACPTARSRTTLPSRRRQSWRPGWTPLR